MNRLPGILCAIESHGSVALIDVLVGTLHFTSTLIGAGEEVARWRIGAPVVLVFPEAEVSLAKNLSGLLSMRNRIPAVITAIERGSLLARVTLAFGEHRIESVITTRSSHALALQVGDAVEGLVKSNEMTVLPEQCE